EARKYLEGKLGDGLTGPGRDQDVGTSMFQYGGQRFPVRSGNATKLDNLAIGLCGTQAQSPGVPCGLLPVPRGVPLLKSTSQNVGSTGNGINLGLVFPGLALKVHRKPSLLWIAPIAKDIDAQA